MHTIFAKSIFCDITKLVLTQKFDKFNSKTKHFFAVFYIIVLLGKYANKYKLTVQKYANYRKITIKKYAYNYKITIEKYAQIVDF